MEFEWLSNPKIGQNYIFVKRIYQSENLKCWNNFSTAAKTDNTAIKNFASEKTTPYIITGTLWAN